MQIKDTEIRFIKNDVTKSGCEAVVCPVPVTLNMDTGPAALIKRRAGKDIAEELLKKGPARVGETVWTPAGKLKASYIIHAVMTGKDRRTDEAILRLVCANALKSADELNVSSLALPALGCEIGAFDVVGAAKIISQEMIKYCRRTASGIREIVFCLPESFLYRSFEQTISGYVSHIQDRLGEGPYATVDIIIEFGKGVVLVERSNPPYGWALPGGFVDYGESLETAARREAKEETNLDLKGLAQFHSYSRPDRDPRFHTISTVFTAQGKGKLRSGDDAKNVKLVPHAELRHIEYAFDHKEIIGEYLNKKENPR